MKKSAFTLIELLVVIVIIGILATIGVAQFHTYNEKARLAKAKHFDHLVERTLLYNVESPLIGRWPMSDNTTTDVPDSSGNGNNLTMKGGASWDNDTPNEEGYSVFTPTNSTSPWGIITTNGSALQNKSQLATDGGKSFTLTTWFKMESLPVFPQTSYIIQMITGTNVGGGVRISHNGTLAAWAREDASEEYISDGKANVITLGKWQHLAFDVNPQGIRVYLDGELIIDKAPEADFDGVDVSSLLYFNFGIASSGASYKIHRPTFFKSSIGDAL